MTGVVPEQSRRDLYLALALIIIGVAAAVWAVSWLGVLDPHPPPVTVVTCSTGEC